MRVFQAVRLTALSLVIAGLAGCAAAPRQEGPPPGAGPPINWDNPFPGGSVRLDSVTRARPLLRFEPIPPRNLGTSRSILVSNPSDPERTGMLALVFQHPKFGRFWVLQEASQTSQAELEAFPGHNTDPGNTATLSLVTIRGATTALLQVGPSTTSIEWLEGTIKVTVIGPPDSFTPDVAMAVANGI